MKMETATKSRKSSTNRRVRQSRAPTKQKKSPTGYKSILVPIDFSETSIRALDYALALAGEFGAQIHLLHVLEFPAVFNSVSQPSYAAWDNEAKKAAAGRLSELV